MSFKKKLLALFFIAAWPGETSVQPEVLYQLVAVTSLPALALANVSDTDAFPRCFYRFSSKAVCRCFFPVSGSVLLRPPESEQSF
jgi:hypothetical protein